jgi:hypothetical protein
MCGVGHLRLRHCEERSDAAIQRLTRGNMDCFASLAMTGKARAGFGFVGDVGDVSHL